MRISLQQITDNKISLLQFSAQDEVVITNFNNLLAAIAQNTSLKTIITHHLKSEDVIWLKQICNDKGINYLNFNQHRVTHEGVSPPILSGSPKLPNIPSDILYEVATHAASSTFDIDSESILDLAMLPNNNLVLVQYAAAPIASLRQLVSMDERGPNVKMMIIDLTNKAIIAETHCSFYKGLEVCPGNSNHVAVLTEEKIMVLNTAQKFKLVTSIDVAAKSIKFLPDGNIIAIPMKKAHTSGESSSQRLPSYLIINPLTLKVSPSDSINFHEINPETNQTTPTTRNPKIDKIVVLSTKKVMTTNQIFAEMLTFQDKNEINTREQYVNEVGKQHQLAIDANTVATGSNDGIQIWDGKKHLTCKAGNLYTSNAVFLKLIYFPEQKLLASVFNTCIYFWKIGGRALALQGVFPIPKDCKIIVTTDNKLMVAENNKGKLAINTFNVTQLNPSLKFQDDDEIKLKSTETPLPFFNTRANNGLARLPLTSQPTVAFQTASVFTTPFRVNRP